MISDKFIWFIGIVEDINDPKKLGRVKVRMINEYSNRVDTEDLPWAIPMTPINSASYLGIGSSPTGLQKGSRVIGFFMDGEQKTKPVVMGTHPIILNGNESEHSVSEQARGNGPVKKDYLEYEPKTAYASEYPNNNTISTKSGHIIEIDDTPKAERIHIYHKNGSYIEMNPDGSMVVKSADKSVDIAYQDKEIYSASGDVKIESKSKDVNIKSKSKANIEGSTVEISSDGSMKIQGGRITIEGSRVDINGVVRVNGKPV